MDIQTPKITELIKLLEPHVDSEILADLEAFRENRRDSAHVFSSKWYSRHLYLNRLCYYFKYNSPTDTKFILYTGGLGQGNYLELYYSLGKGYTFRAFDALFHETSRYIYETTDWPAMKEEIDRFFEKIQNPGT